MSKERKIPYKIYLEESEMPKAWYNLRADMKNKPAPLLNPGTRKPLGVEIDNEVNDETMTRKGKEGIITTNNSKIDAYVIATDEELMIARDTYKLANN